GPGGNQRMGKYLQASGAGLAQPLLELLQPSEAARQAGVEQARFEERQYRGQGIALPQGHQELDQVPQVPALLPAMSDQGQDLPLRRLQLLEAPVDHCRIANRGQAALNQLLSRPLIARLEQSAGNLPKKGLIVALQGILDLLGPVGSIGYRHL